MIETLLSVHWIGLLANVPQFEDESGVEVLVGVQDCCRWPVDVLLLCVSISDSLLMFFDPAFQRSISLLDIGLGTDVAGDAVYDAHLQFHAFGQISCLMGSNRPCM